MAQANLGKVMLTPKGNYNAATEYARLDFVLYNGSSWVSKVDGNIGHTPADGAYWQELASSGENITITSSETDYAMQTAEDYTGDPPEDGWQSTIPYVAGGNYLWTRDTLTFSDGTTTNTYLTTRYGVDGSGAVSTVNGVSPDATGNVALQITDIAQVDATPQTDSQNLVRSGGVAQAIYSAVSNLLAKITSGAGTRVYAHTGATQGDLGIDNTPTAGSNNLITSGGVEAVTSAQASQIASKADKGNSFTVTLRGGSTAWENNQQTVYNLYFATSHYAYLVSPESSSFEDYGKAQIYADDVTTATYMTFHCKEIPTSDLTVNIVRVVTAE